MEAISEVNTAKISAVTHAVCAHCKLPIPPKRQSSTFCCSGCEAVYRFIQASGFGEYYSLKKDSIGRAVQDLCTSYSYMDDETFSKTYVTNLASSTQQISFFLSGIHCAACIWLLERLPQLVQNVRSARVDFGRSTVTVQFDAQLLKLSFLASTLHSLGYPPTATSPETTLEQTRQSNQAALIRLGVAAVCAMNIMMLSVSLYEGDKSGMEPFYQQLLSWGCFFLALPSITYCAWPFYQASLGGIRAGLLHIDLPISVAIVIAFIASAINTILGRFEVYYDSIAALVLLLLAGRFLQKRSMQKAVDASHLLSSLTPKAAKRISNGKVEEVYVGSLAVGDVLRIEPGDLVPADGLLQSNNATLDLAVLTGESIPQLLNRGDEVFASARNVGSYFEVQITKTGTSTRIGGVMQLLEESASSRPRIALFLDAVSRFFVWAVMLASGGTFAYWYLWRADLTTAIDATVALLVVSCPCVVALATPLTFSLAIGRAARSGILLKGQEVIERLKQTQAICLDKTRTLTLGQFSVQLSYVDPDFINRIWSILERIEQNQRHPLAEALKNYARSMGSSPAETTPVQNTRVVPGAGVECVLGSEIWRIGTAKFVELPQQCSEELSRIAENIKSQALSSVYVSCNGAPVALFGLADSIRPEAASVVNKLKNLGYELYILSGDSGAVVQAVAAKLGIASDHAFGELTPEGKANIVEKIAAKKAVAMVGDGVNDTLALQRAHVGIGVHGSAEVCLSTADVYSYEPGLSPILLALNGAKQTFGVMYRNLCFSGAYNVFGSLLAISGLLGPLGAAVLMPLSSLTVVLSAILSTTFRAAAQQKQQT